MSNPELEGNEDSVGSDASSLTNNGDGGPDGRQEDLVVSSNEDFSSGVLQNEVVGTINVESMVMDEQHTRTAVTSITLPMHMFAPDASLQFMEQSLQNGVSDFSLTDEEMKCIDDITTTCFHFPRLAAILKQNAITVPMLTAMSADYFQKIISAENYGTQMHLVYRFVRYQSLAAQTMATLQTAASEDVILTNN